MMTGAIDGIEGVNFYPDIDQGQQKPTLYERMKADGVDQAGTGIELDLKDTIEVIERGTYFRLVEKDKNPNFTGGTYKGHVVRLNENHIDVVSIWAKEKESRLYSSEKRFELDAINDYKLK